MTPHWLTTVRAIALVTCTGAVAGCLDAYAQSRPRTPPSPCPPNGAVPGALCSTKDHVTCGADRRNPAHTCTCTSNAPGAHKRWACHRTINIAVEGPLPPPDLPA